MPVKRLTLFKFGYDGWGNSTRQLIKAVNAVEHHRGFRPPVWVDIRARSSVRAAGFCGSRLADVVGTKNYRVIKDLGNANVLDGATDGVRIIDPRKSGALLEVAEEAWRDRRRVMFFCQCPDPEKCHRTKVGRTHLMRAAAKREVQVVEWPGGQPRQRRISIKIERDWLKGASIEFPTKPRPLWKFAGLPAGSLVRLYNTAGWEKTVAVKALKFEGGAWRLPLVRAGKTKRILVTADEVSLWRTKGAYEPHLSRAWKRGAKRRAVTTNI